MKREFDMCCRFEDKYNVLPVWCDEHCSVCSYGYGGNKAEIKKYSAKINEGLKKIASQLMRERNKK